MIKVCYLSQLLPSPVPSLPPHPLLSEMLILGGQLSGAFTASTQQKRFSFFRASGSPKIKSHWPRNILYTPLSSGLQQILTPKTRPDSDQGVTIQGKHGLDSQEKERIKINVSHLCTSSLRSLNAFLQS